MKKVLFVLLAIMLAMPMMAQRVPSPKKSSISAGFMQGGGGLVGVDFEHMLGNHFSAQVGAGFVSFGAAINYHFKPFINSSMVSLGYYHQGVGNSYAASWLGPVYTFRAPKIFQFQIGFGFKVGEGPAASADLMKTSMTLLYSIGVYFPI